MEVSDGVVGDDVTGSVDLDGIIAADFVRAVGAGAAPQRAGPADQQVALLDTAEKDVVGNIEVARSGVLGPDAEADVLEAAVPDGEADGAVHLLESREDGDVGVAEGKSVEDVMGGSRDVEQAVVARAVEDDFAVTGGFDGDGFFGCGLDREPIRSVERRHHRVDVVETVIAVEAGMDEDRVARLNAPLPDDVPIAEPGAVVGLEQAGEVGFLPRALVIGRIDVADASVRVGPRLGSGGDADGLGRWAAGAVGIGQLEAALVFRAGLQIEDASREAVRDGVFEVLAFAEDSLPSDAHQRKSRTPFGIADAAELDRDGGVAVVVAGDGPLEAEIVQSRMLDDESARTGAVVGVGGGGEEEKAGRQENAHKPRF